MAITSNTYTGNGSNKLFSITFPYLETTDVDVYLNGVLQTVTTQYTFANATTIEFVAAPGNGVTVILQRSTNTEDLNFTFFPGSSIKAADLNENFDQVFYIAQETNNNVANAVAGQIPNGTITSAKIADDTIVNADVNASAGIVATKLAFTPNGTGAVARTVDSKLKDVVSVKDFGAVGNGIANDTAAFNLAAATATNVLIPKGTYLITAAISTAACWQLEKGAVISGLSNKGTAGGGVQDTSRLTGTFVSLSSGGVNVLKVGDTDPWLTGPRDTVDYLSNFMSVSPVGGFGASFATRSSDNPTANMQTVGVGIFPVNDNTSSPEPSWGIYNESIRYANTGPAFGAELDFVNLGNTNNLTPFSVVDPYSSVNAPTAHLWLSCGGGDSGLAASANNISAAIVLLPNIKKFNNGIVIRNGSIETSNIVVAPEYYKYTWLDSSERTASTLDHRQHYRAVYSDTTGLAPADLTAKYKANGTSPTVSGETIFSSNNQGYDGSALHQGAGVSVTQETNFSSGTARFNHTLTARNSDGGFTTVGLNYGANATFTPIVDNAVGLGKAATRWSVVYAGTGTINTSDARLKQDIIELSDKEQLVAKNLKTLIRRFKYIDAVKEKGDNARYHFGVIAQDVVEAFAQQGLDATEYGILCYDEWEDQLDILDNDGNVIQAGRKAGNTYGVRYEELLAFIISVL